MLVLFVMVALFTVSTYASEYDTKNATAFVFSDNAIKVTEGAYTAYKIEGTALTIQGSGTYVVSGSAANGSITVKKGTTGVTLVLNGLTLTNEDTAVLSCNKSTQVTIIAASGTVNTLTDSELNNDETHPENENAENAVIKCKDGSKVTLAGSGTLNVVSNGKNAIKSGATTETEGEASLSIKDLNLIIKANVNDAINAEAELNVLSGNLEITASDDAIHSDIVLNIGEKGTEGPTIKISKSAEGLEGATINIYSGDITLYATDDGVNAANADLSGYAFSINVYGGVMNVTVGQGDTDAFDANGDINIYGGTINVTAPTSAFDFDGKGTLSEDATVTVNGQQITTLTNSMMGGMPGGRQGGFGGFPGQDGNWGQFGRPGMTKPNGGETPEFPGNGERPEFPGNGETPGFPGNGERPEFPGNGEAPEFPGNGERPEFPGNGETPEFPGNGERSAFPDKSGESEEAPAVTNPGTQSGTGESRTFFESVAEWFVNIWKTIVNWFTGK